MSSTTSTSQPANTSAMPATRPSGFFTRVGRMCTRFPIRDTSYLTAVFFWLGAAFFAVNGFFYVLETTQPQTDFDTESTVAAPVSSCLGDFFFFLGCSSAIFEALNIGRGEINGATPGDHHQMETDQVPEIPKDGDVQPWPVKSAVPREKPTDLEEAISPPTTTLATALIGSPGFIWYPSLRQLRGHYMKDVAFVASVISWIGIVFFTIATIAGIPGVANLDVIPVYYYLYLLPTFLGGFFFFVAAAMQTTLTQRRWYLPALNRLSWYVGFWNSVGSIGFALGGCLWYAGESAYWAATLASFWGSWGWFIGSTLAWYIIMDNYP